MKSDQSPYLKNPFIATAAAALVLVAATGSLASPITVPTGLNPGDAYRLVFVTSTTLDATSSDIADYNAFVSGVANTVPELVALGTTWTAIGPSAGLDGNKAPSSSNSPDS